MKLFQTKRFIHFFSLLYISLFTWYLQGAENDQFTKIVARGNAPEFRTFLEQNPDLIEKQIKNPNPVPHYYVKKTNIVNYVAQYGSPEIVSALAQFLRETGRKNIITQETKRGSDKYNAFHFAAYSNNPDTIRTIAALFKEEGREDLLAQPERDGGLNAFLMAILADNTHSCETITTVAELLCTSGYGQALQHTTNFGDTAFRAALYCAKNSEILNTVVDILIRKKCEKVFDVVDDQGYHPFVLGMVLNQCTPPQPHLLTSTMRAYARLGRNELIKNICSTCITNSDSLAEVTQAGITPKDTQQSDNITNAMRMELEEQLLIEENTSSINPKALPDRCWNCMKHWEN